MSPELLVAPAGYAWGTAFMAVFLALMAVAIARHKRREHRPHWHPRSPDDHAAMAMLAIFVAGFLAWLLHPLLPLRPWPPIVLRDLAYHFGIPGSLVLFAVVALIRWLEHPRFPSALRPHVRPWRLALAGVVLLGVMAWSTRIAVLDVLDLASAPITARGHLVAARRAYRSLEGSVTLDTAGPLILAHGTTLRSLTAAPCEVTFTPHRRLVLSVREDAPPPSPNRRG